MNDKPKRNLSPLQPSVVAEKPGTRGMSKVSKAILQEGPEEGQYPSIAPAKAQRRNISPEDEGLPVLKGYSSEE